MKVIFIMLMLILNLKVYSYDCIESAFFLFQNGNYNESIIKLKNCENDIIEFGTDKEIIKFYYGLGRSYLEMGNIDSAFKYQLISFNIQKSFNQEFIQNLTYNDLGIIYQKIGLQHKSIYFLNNAITINKSIDNKKLLFDNFLNLGATYDDICLKDSAEKYLLLAKELSMYVSKLKKAKLYNNLGVLYQNNNEYDKSKKYLELAIEKCEDDEIEKLKIKTNLQLTLLYKGEEVNFGSFDEYYKKAVHLDDRYYEGDAIFKMSLIDISKKDSTLTNLRNAIKILSEYNNYFGSLFLLNEYKRFSIKNGLKISRLTQIENHLLRLNSNRITKEYDNELKINQESYTLINHLKNELYYANISFYGIFLLFLLFILLTGTAIFAIKKNKLINRFIAIIRNSSNKDLIEVNKAKVDLCKLTYMLDNRLDYNGNKLIFLTLDKVIKNVNNLNYFQLSSKNKEVECQILQHQQITNGKVTH